MEKENKLVQKVKQLLRKARVPRFLNRFGPKSNPLWQFYLCHCVYTKYCRNWRDAAKFMDEFYGISLHFTTWQKAIAKWPMWLWHLLQKASVHDDDCDIAAIDGTGISRSNPSQHYVMRIGGLKSSRPLQGLFMVDVKRRKFLSWRIRAKPRGEKCDVPYLLEHSPVLPETVLMDKGFDANWVHSFLRDQGVYSIAPTKKGCKHGRYRKQLRDCFDHGLYWQRSIVESLIGAVKRKYGEHVRARTARTQRAEWFTKLILFNILSRIIQDFLQSLHCRNV